ncbi:OLC1v1000694C1 [Oldenlandia corymbosa var. corymbosa]|uniref:OLC1v1000694C1 n=1 Tax=Oldenlandia corymbosa var. corymbosa TaxID=529605 RepID=A0AAV1D4B2_OLDCO|nr:OLC1v1000694C1 [Oldenlandia corymbosa var. corymbosa]
MDTTKELPVISFTGENLKPGTKSWRSTCKAVREAMEEFSSFIAVYDNDGKLGGPGPELMRSVFSSMEEFFDLPKETKLINTSQMPGFGYFGEISENLLETAGIGDSTNVEAVRRFSDLMWPSGNDKFCETMNGYAAQVSKYGEIVTRMVFESYGVEKYCDSHVDSSSYLLRINTYRVPKLKETNVGVHAHTDATFISILKQDEARGLEVQYSKDGAWIPVDFPPSSFAIIAGDALLAWSNGKIQPCFHRVTIADKPRLSIGLFCFHKGIVQVPKEFAVGEDIMNHYPNLMMSWERLEILIRSFRALIRPLLNWSDQYQDGLKEGLQDVDDLLQMFLLQELDQQKRASSNFATITKEMEQVLLQCQLTHSSHCSMRTWKGVEHTVSFMDSVLQNFRDEVKKDVDDAFISPAKKGILDICDELKLMNDMFWLINLIPGTMYLITCLDVAFIIEKIGVEISCLLYNWIMDNMDDAELLGYLKEDFYSLQEKSKEGKGSVMLSERMNSLCNSVRNFILDTGFLIYFSRLDHKGRRGNHRAEQGSSYASQTNKEEGDEKERTKYRWFQLPCFLHDVTSLKQQANDLVSVCNQVFSSSRITYSSRNPMVSASFKDKSKDMKMEESHDKLVGMRDTTMEVIHLLTSIKATRLTSLSIVGMPGLGKTTLASSVYKHPSIVTHFHVRAWCRASQFNIKEALLSEIWCHIGGKANETHEMVREDIALKVYQTLKGMKYLIVIDDIWDAELWNDLKESFPDDHNGSRILFTTQRRAVALEINSIPYALRLLSDEKSSKLLLLHVFDGGNCPAELSMISKRIARNCKGLPLAVVLTAGILKKTESRKVCWEQVAKKVFSLRREREKYCELKDVTNIVAFSYKQLPDFLKPCFYYFGAFPVDTSISVSKLTKLWISEGFVQKQDLGQKHLKQKAEDFLQELIDRSLVMIAKRSSKGGVKACRVHTVIRQFCSEMLRSKVHVLEENALDAYSSFHHNLNVRSTTYLFHYRSYPATKFGRFQFQDVSDGSNFRPRLGHTEKIVFGNEPGVVRGVISEGGLLMCTRTNQSKRFDYGLISKFLSLQVLDLGNVRVESSADTSDLVTIAKLIHLRYLSIRLRRNKLPPEIGNLQNLETLVLSGVIGIILLPWSTKNLSSLRHLLSDHGIFIFPQSFIELQSFDIHFPLLDNLTSISTLPLKRGNKVENFVLRRLPGIQKLGCRFFSDAWDNSTGFSMFPELDFLNELESLNITFSGKVVSPCRFSFPSNLTKLSISNSRLPWEEISVIARLVPHLQVLKLLGKAFEGLKWEMVDGGEFPKLKFLRLESLDIEVWDANAPDHLPFLEQLVVLHCPQLKEIPSSFGDIATLKSIELDGCSSSAMDSVNEILEYQRDMCNDELSVTLGSPA